VAKDVNVTLLYYLIWTRCALLQYDLLLWCCCRFIVTISNCIWDCQLWLVSIHCAFVD